MSSTTRLLVLGVVRIFQPVHGYEVRRELVSWRAQEWASVKAGSIYNALKTLSRDGYLEVVSTDQVGSRPERTTYKLTSAGEEEFRSLLREEWWTVRPPIDPLMAAISFIGYVTRSEAIAALEHRTAQIHGFVRHLEFATEALDGVESPYHVREMHLLMNARVSAELAWAEQLIARLRNGEYATADEPPWRPVSFKHTTAATAAPRRAGKPKPAPASSGPGAARSVRGAGRPKPARTGHAAPSRPTGARVSGRGARGPRRSTGS